jgi:hypothetical protein
VREGVALFARQIPASAVDDLVADEAHALRRKRRAWLSSVFARRA